MDSALAGIIEPVPPASDQTRTRRRLSRTLSRARWPEYAQLLEAAVQRGYRIVSLETWLARDGEDGRVLILRHDVDQHPRSALRMAAIEADLGVTSTWYFRWRTAHPAVVERIRSGGHEVGLHYETLTRLALERGLLDPGEAERLVPECRETLRAELTAFADRFGPCASACPHGDTRAAGIRNAILLSDQEWEAYGLRWDGNEAIKRYELGVWLSDRSSAEGGWGKDRDPLQFLQDGITPMLCVTHPNNWVSGPALWFDRVLSGIAPLRDPARGLTRPVRTGVDPPPSRS